MYIDKIQGPPLPKHHVEYYNKLSNSASGLTRKWSKFNINMIDVKVI